MKTIFTLLFFAASMTFAFAQGQDASVTIADKLIGKMTNTISLSEEQSEKIYAIVADHYAQVEIPEDATKEEKIVILADLGKVIKKDVMKNVLTTEQVETLEAAKAAKKSKADE